jgi:pepF/M3 family oligoendopeptidase
MAFAINGVKGFSISLNKRRNFDTTLDRSILQSRISQKTLNALIASMKASLLSFRKYLRAKAKILEIPQLSFYDIFAPIGAEAKKWSFAEARNLILKQFLSFSTELYEYAKKAFDHNWLDAKPRKGKVDGAYCTDFPLLKESRILSNFNGSFYQLSTIAHELGHGFHHHIIKELSGIHAEYPMTLAETASIFCETIVFNGALKQVENDKERLIILEEYLKGATQVIVDILSRFIFEKELFKQREKGELSSNELCEIMVNAQKETYGEGLNPEELHPYMWAVKGHYYRQDLGFYNFPYAFGHLFGSSLYGLYEKRGKKFISEYSNILLNTGRKSAVDLVKDAGFDIEERRFWDSGIGIINNYINQYVSIAEKGSYK